VSHERFLKKRTAILSGGLGDIGRAIALELARHGANIALGDIRPASDATALLGELKSSEVYATYTQIDIADSEAVRAWVAAVEKEPGLATIIVPNAGIVIRGGVCSLTADDWVRQLHVNLDGAFYLAQKGAAQMVRRNIGGNIVFIGSWAGHAPHHSLAAYCVSKAGVRMLCQCMALELAFRGILVNEVAPGYVNAGLSKQIWDENPGLREQSLKRVPIGSLIEPEEVASQVVALCHPDNRHMTGSVMLMDGGLSLLR
jgi:NAD(P)-dependent dehydrogenase (short-subunit alcohol dehydrogenase family)